MDLHAYLEHEDETNTQHDFQTNRSKRRAFICKAPKDYRNGRERQCVRERERCASYEAGGVEVCWLILFYLFSIVFPLLNFVLVSTFACEE